MSTDLLADVIAHMEAEAPQHCKCSNDSATCEHCSHLANILLARSELASLRTQRAAVTAERDELQAKLEVESASETCVECNQQWNPSLIESGSCIFCIQNETKSQLTTATARLAEAERDTSKLLDALSKVERVRNSMAQSGHDFFIDGGQRAAPLLFDAANAYRAAIDQATATT